MKIGGEMESPPAQVVTPPPKRKRRIRNGLCAIRDFIERHLTANAIVVITVLLLVASWIYPPWVRYGRHPEHDWYFVFSIRTGSMRIDLARLLLIDLIIAVPSALLAWAISRNSVARRIAVRIVFYSIVVLVLALPTVAIVWGGAVLIQNEKHEMANRAAFDPIKAGAIPTKTPFDPDRYLAQTAPAKVEPTDLNKITLFDFGPDCYQSDACTGFHGRVRNDLSRAVERIGLKASFYNSAGQLIEVRTFWMLDPNWQMAALLPNSPVTFHSRVAVDRLPAGWKYLLEVIEAHYVSK